MGQKMATAIEENNIHVIREMLANGFPIASPLSGPNYEPPKSPKTAFRLAADLGREEVLLCILEYESSLQVLASVPSTTPLVLDVRCNAVLLEAGASANQGDRGPCMLAHYIAQPCLAGVALLLKHNVRVTTSHLDQAGQETLSSPNSSVRRGIFKCLLWGPENCVAKNIVEEVLASTWPKALKLQQYELVELLLVRGARLYQSAGFQFNCGMIDASNRGDYRMVNLLLRHGFDVISHAGLSASSLAVGNGYDRLTRLLVTSGVDVGHAEGTSLYTAVSSGDLQIVQILLQKPTAVSRRSSLGRCVRNALNLASWRLICSVDSSASQDIDMRREMVYLLAETNRASQSDVSNWKPPRCWVDVMLRGFHQWLLMKQGVREVL
ncbi:uncharacterized protein RCC_12315 [Ramularia collo-cygni]|uniref:Uncharacterized protein n=1 Tax=Ramularia collo-cygni TaxID=112498 RepID=A0A2D3UNV6_9PEZI|nr:uncharacterized protein RCC_12315 [Ramularia collo-cygni]CZT15288.1 uncharacterized protein RCC_12315 [Ramularia collo-cygni]